MNLLLRNWINALQTYGFVRTIMERAGKHELASDHFREIDPVDHSFSRVFSQFKLHRLDGFVLNDGHSFANSVVAEKVIDLQCHQVATA